MRILHLIYTTGVAGAEKHLLYLLPELKKFNIDCELLLVCPQKNFASLQNYSTEMQEKGIRTTFLPVRSKLFYLTAARKIYRYLRSGDIKIVHSHLFSADIIAVLIKKMYFKKLVILSTKHGYEEKYLVQYGLGNKNPTHNFYYFISRAVIKRIDHNLTVSRALSEMYRFLKLVKNKMKYIHHGINLQSPAVKQIQPKGNPVIMITGRLYPIKGHAYLFKALPAIIQKFPRLKLVVLGDGPSKDELIKLATGLDVLNHIEFEGFAEPGMYSRSCEVMVLPSLFESFGLVYIESFALKIPVVAFKAEAVNEIIVNGETGILVSKGDIKILADKIIHLLESPGERSRIIKNAYDKYRSYYNAERMAKETAEWYRDVLPNKP